jgi:hypothetical protein
MQFVKIWCATILFAVGYGIAHDEVTARVSIEYFTVGHPPLVETNSATLVAVAWGVVATWWVGALGGFLLAAAARIGPAPRIGMRELLVPGGVLLGAMAFLSLLAGLTGYVFARLDLVAIDSYFARNVPASSHDRFVADSWAHLSAYISGAIGCLVLCLWVIVKRVAHSRAGSRFNARNRRVLA